MKANPKSAEVYLDNKLAKKTDPIFGQAIIKNLLPKSYLVSLKKEGFQNWQKKLQVKEKTVTEAEFIWLAPEKIDFTALTKGNNFWLSPDAKKIAIYQKESSGRSKWSLKLFDLKKNLKSALIEEKDISSFGADLLDLEWAEDSRNIYLAAGAKEQEKNYVLDTEKAPIKLLPRKMPTLPESPYLAKFPVQPETEYRVNDFAGEIFLREGDTLFVFNKDSDPFEKVLENVLDLKISSDKEKLAIFTNSEIWVFYLRTREKTLLTRLSRKIGEVFWFNENYLIFNSGDQIKIMEIDNRDYSQIWDIASFAEPKIFFSYADKKLFVLSNGNLLVSESF